MNYGRAMKLFCRCYQCASQRCVEAGQFIMDYLKTAHRSGSAKPRRKATAGVEARESDQQAAKRW
ncbi:hypothetical protein DMI69_23595 [Escherichia coli]|nr:hypothetical protein [Escherichia coli]